MKKKVFISSTYSDLVTFRREIWEVLSHREVKILGMEIFGARKNKPLKTCLDEVSKSDIYIGIIGARYGSVDQASGKSYTQLEYEKAVKDNLEILVYIIDENCKVPLKFVDTGENALKLESFKRYLMKEHTIDTFMEESVLAKKIHDKLKELIPNFSTSVLRAKAIDCKLHRFDLDNGRWIVFLGYYAEQLIEIHSVPTNEETFPVPQKIQMGKIVQNRDEKGVVRFDFQYRDMYGYTITMGGLNRVFNQEVYNYLKIINRLLLSSIQESTLIEFIADMDTSTITPSAGWKEGLIRAIKR